ncbi:MAG: hypothetical protein WB626_01470, partial [Bacteroidota bacterium]
MRRTHDRRRAWGGSVLLHLLTALLLFLWRRDEVVSEPDFLEFQWGPVSGVRHSPGNSGRMSPGPAPDAGRPGNPTPRLPERRMFPHEESLPVPQGGKVAAESPPAGRVPSEGSSAVRESGTHLRTPAAPGGVGGAGTPGGAGGGIA